MKKKFDRRMHSAEHILKQSMGRMFGCGRSITAHIEPRKSKCDYLLCRTLKHEEVRDVERRVNEVIQADMVVMEEFATREIVPLFRRACSFLC